MRAAPNIKYSSDFTAMSNMAFSNAPNVFSDVQKETTYGAKTFSAITQVRVDGILNVSTGQSLGDDFKRFTFDPSFGSPYIGQLFIWKGSYWLGINTDNYQSLAKSLIVRRCNNVLRWKDSYNNLVTEPCVLSYVLKEPGDYTTSQMVLASGFVNLFCQRNTRTNTIRENKRFLFGVPENRSAYRVYGSGRKTFLNSITTDETSPSVSEFYMGASFINEMTDDLVNGIADAYRNEYTISIADGDIIQTTGFSKTLVAELKHNGEIVAGQFVWTTDDDEIVSVTSGGVIECLEVGSAKIKCSMYNNALVYDEITVYVSAELSNNYEVVVSPANQLIYEGETQQYECILMNNGLEVSATFVFTSSGVPSDNYRLYAIDGNNFSVENIEKYLGASLSILCTSGTHTKTFTISLRGDF